MGILGILYVNQDFVATVVTKNRTPVTARLDDPDPPVHHMTISADNFFSKKFDSGYFCDNYYRYLCVTHKLKTSPRPSNF